MVLGVLDSDLALMFTADFRRIRFGVVRSRIRVSDGFQAREFYFGGEEPRRGTFEVARQCATYKSDMIPRSRIKCLFLSAFINYSNFSVSINDFLVN